MAPDIDLQIVREIDLGSPVGQCRAAPVRLGSGRVDAILVAYGADFDVDPYVEMFFFPTDTLKLVLIDLDGRELWRRDLGRGVVPGVWFCPVLPFDLDGDGVDEVYYVDQVNTNHPLSLEGFRLRRLDAATGEPTGQAPWPEHDRKLPMGPCYRHFLVGGHAHGEPVLVLGQGTYGAMILQGLGAGLAERWTAEIDANGPGACGSHMCPVVDLNGDGVDELMWGERCLSLADGRELFCADRDAYRGHSDVIQPMLDRDTGAWSVYTIRESDPEASPRVVLFDAQGERVWGDVDCGHMDMGWCARLGEGGRHVASAVRIGHKTCGPDGRFHQDVDEFVFDASTGRRLDPGYSVYRTLPVDVNGDGLHELVRGQPSGDGEVLDRHGRVIGGVGGAVAMASKFMDLPGEQMLSYHADGRLRIWADANAADSAAALARYAHPFYQANQRLTATGYNLVNLGGI